MGGTGTISRPDRPHRHPEQTGRSDSQPGAQDRTWPSALLLGLTFTAAAMAWSLLYYPAHGLKGYRTPGDFWVTLRSAQYVANGALGYIYEATVTYYSLPLFPILLAPLAWMVEYWHLTEAPVPTATAWLLVGPFALATAVPLLYAVRSLAVAAGRRGRELTAQLGIVVLVLGPVAWKYGHYEDILALAFTMVAVREVINGRSSRAAALVGLAVGCKQWAVVVVPLVVLLFPGKRLKLAAIALALPCLLAGFPLLVDWEHAHAHLLGARNFPQFGHLALWADGSGDTVLTLPFRLVALAIAIAISVLVSRRRFARDPRALFAALGIILYVRCLFEPVLHAYYLAPALAFLLLHEGHRRGRYRRTLTLGCALFVVFAFHSHPVLWWMTFALASAALLAPAAQDLMLAKGGGCPEMGVMSLKNLVSSSDIYRRAKGK